MNINDLIGYKAPPNIDQIIAQSIKLDAPFQHFATVYAKDPKGIITGIGQSKRNNLILNNLGEWLAGFFRSPVAGEKSVTLKGDDGANNTVYVYTDRDANEVEFNYCSALAGGSNMHFGKGTTAAARTDTDIETDLTNAPESGFFGTGNGSYAAGVVSVSGSITAGGNENITEVGLYGHWYEETGDAHDDHMLFHDIVTSVPFVLGETLTGAYSIQL